MSDKVISLFGCGKARRPKSTTRSRTNEKRQKTLDEEVIEAVHAVIDAVLKQAASQLKRMDHEDAEIVLKELEASMLRVERATQLANLRQ